MPSTQHSIRSLLDQIDRIDIEADYVLIRFKKPVKLSVDEYRALLVAGGEERERAMGGFREDE